MIDFVKTFPGYPPEDYTGTQADWMVALQERGLWDGKGWHGDAEVPADTYAKILEECEQD